MLSTVTIQNTYKRTKGGPFDCEIKRVQLPYVQTRQTNVPTKRLSNLWK